VRYGIIGCGSAWEFHRSGSADNPRMEFVALHDVDEKKARRVAKRYKMEAFSTLEGFLNADIDAVIVMVPHFLHEDLVIRAAEAGKHVLCEKPMATTLEECDNMIAACRKAGVKFMIAENHRFLPAHRWIMNAVRRGLIGKVFLVRAYEGVNEISGLMKKGFWKGDPLKAGGGALADMGVHKFATLRWILNDDVVAGYSWITKQLTSLEEKAEDNAMMFLQYESGTIAEIVVSFTVNTPPTNSLEIHGSKGTILENHAWQKPVKINSFHEDMGVRRGIWHEPEIEHGPFPKYYQISARIEDAHFTECILEDRDPEFTPEEAREAVATVLLGYLSARLGRTATREDLMDVKRARGTRSILEGLEKIVKNNH